MKLLQAVIREAESVNADIFRLVLEFDEKFPAQAGQFINIRVSALDVPLLRRPISISRILDDKHIELLIREMGIGTQQLRAQMVGQRLDLIGPLGRGFDLSAVGSDASVLIVGGGIGVAPLRGLVQALESRGQKSITAVNGFRENPFCAEDFTATEYHEVDESVQREFVTDYLKKNFDMTQFDQVYACGPHPMLRTLKTLCENAGVPLQISLEEKMACGIGVCLGCAVKVKVGDFGHTYKKVCADGPVFDSLEVIFDE